MRAKNDLTEVPATGQLRAVRRSGRSQEDRIGPHRNRQPDRTRHALIEAAAKVFNSAGFHGTDSNRIAREAGYAPGTFYVHFPDKMAIFLEVYRSWVTTEWSSIEAILKAGGSVSALSRRLSRAVVEHHRKWRTFRASLRALSATDERVHAARVASRAQQIETMSRLIRGRNARVPSRAKMLGQLLIAEALCDAIAEGDTRSLGIREEEIVKLLDQSGRELLAG